MCSRTPGSTPDRLRHREIGRVAPGRPWPAPMRSLRKLSAAAGSAGKRALRCNDNRRCQSSSPCVIVSTTGHGERGSGGRRGASRACSSCYRRLVVRVQRGRRTLSGGPREEGQGSAPPGVAVAACPEFCTSSTSWRTKLRGSATRTVLPAPRHSGWARRDKCDRDSRRLPDRQGGRHAARRHTIADPPAGHSTGG